MTLVVPIHAEGKLCPKCGNFKEAFGFALRLKGPRKGHLVAHCKLCMSINQSNLKARDKTLYERVERNSKYKHKYGITLEDYGRMFAEQGGKCAICFTTSPGVRVRHFQVDHCHKTGAVRGLLCHKCNRAVGLLNDNIDNVRRVAAYLEKGRIQ